MLKVLFVVLVGRLFTHLTMNLPPAKRMSVKWLDGWFIDLFHCDLCFSFYLYFILCCLFGVEITSLVDGVGYLPIVSEVITAATFSWFMHVFFLGVRLKWGSFND
jgi:hypothetical protein